MDNKDFNNNQNFSYKSMNDKNGGKRCDNTPYETPKHTISKNIIKDDNTKYYQLNNTNTSTNFLSPNRFQHLRNYDTKDTNVSNIFMSPHNLNTIRKEELPHNNLTVTITWQKKPLMI